MFHVGLVEVLLSSDLLMHSVNIYESICSKRRDETLLRRFFMFRGFEPSTCRRADRSIAKAW